MKTLLVDFDGTLHTYSGWKGPDILDGPLEGARAAMYLLAKEYQLVCFTTRPSEIVEGWLRKWGFPTMRVTNIKLPAHLIVDDRALRFERWTDDFINQIRHARPHWEGLDEDPDAPQPGSI